MPGQYQISRRSVLLMPVCLAVLGACSAEKSVLKISGQTMGTSYSIVAVDPGSGTTEEELQQVVEKALKQVDLHLSNWNPNSEISRFNASRSLEPVPMSPMLKEVMQAAQEIHQASEGQLDVTLGPLIQLWGFGSKTKQDEAPGEDQIAAALQASGQNRTLEISGNSLQKRRPETEIYLAAIGKGYGVDVIARVIESFGMKDYLVEIGGDLYASGNNPDGQPWKIGIETPDAHDRTVKKIVGLSNLGMATSGDYRNYFEKEGVRYSHILDARTGRPITHKTASVTVLAENAMKADAWATAMLVLGRERGLEIANKRDLAVLFIERDTNAPHTKFKATPSARFSELQP